MAFKLNSLKAGNEKKLKVPKNVNFLKSKELQKQDAEKAFSKEQEAKANDIALSQKNNLANSIIPAPSNTWGNEFNGAYKGQIKGDVIEFNPIQDPNKWASVNGTWLTKDEYSRTQGLNQQGKLGTGGSSGRSELTPAVSDILQQQALRNDPRYQAMLQNQPYFNQMSSEVQDLGMIKPEGGEYGAALGMAGAKTLGGAAAGAVAGSIIPGAGTIAGGLIGGITGLVTSGFSAVPNVDKDQVNKANKRYLGSKATIAAMINLANKGQLGKADAVERWEKVMNDIAISKAQLKYLSRNDVAEWSSGADDDMIKLEQYEQTLQVKLMILQEAMLKPNPNAPIDYEGLTDEDATEITG